MSPWVESREGFKHRLIMNLRAQGLSHREADAAIDIVVNTIKDALQRHEAITIEGFGTFKVVPTPAPQKAWKFGRVVTLHEHDRFTVVFEEAT